MKSGLKDYINEFEDQLNLDLMNKSADAPLVDYIVDSWKSLEVIPQLKFIGYEYTDKESEIDINKHIFKREKKKKKKDRHDIKFINNDRVGKLVVHLEATMKEVDHATGEISYKVYPIKKTMLIPLQDEDGYFIIKGKKYYMIYQMLEKSTYTSSSSVTLKSLMPIAVKRNVIAVEDIEGNNYQLPVYYVFVFRKEICILLFYLSNGLNYTLDYLHVINSISFTDKMPEPDKKYLYFALSNKCWLKVVKEDFENHAYIQSIVGAFCTICTNRTTIELLNDERQWIKKIANPASYEKGLGILKYFNRLLDVTTKKVLKLPEYDTEDIYSLLRWMMEEFQELRLKDNMDLSNKRLRCNEYIASLLTKEFSKRLNRIISLGDKVTIVQIKELFKFSGDILIQKMHASGILRFDDNVNDMNFWSKFKYTNKGPHSLGTNNSNNIGIKYRGLHPSFLGHIDVLVCGNSDPGTSGLLSPFSKMDGLYFNEKDEPSDFFFNLNKEIEKRCKKEHINYIKVSFDNPRDYYNALMDMERYVDENIKVSGTSVEGQYELFIEDEEDMDEEKKASTSEKDKKDDKK